VNSKQSLLQQPHAPLALPDKPPQPIYTRTPSPGTASSVHDLSYKPAIRPLARMRHARRALARLKRRHIHIIGRPKPHRIASQIHLIKIKRKHSLQLHPSSISQRKTSPMIGMTIQRPMREHHIRLFIFNRLNNSPYRAAFTSVAPSPVPKNNGRALSICMPPQLSRPNPRSLFRALPSKPRFPARQINRNNLMPRNWQSSHRPTTPRLRIARRRADAITLFATFAASPSAAIPTSGSAATDSRFKKQPPADAAS